MTTLSRVVRLLAIIAIAFPSLLVVEAAAGWTVQPAYPLYAGMVAVFAFVGWLISERQPGNAVGPLMVTFALLFSLSLPADPYVTSPAQGLGQDLAAMAVSMVDAPLFALLALTLIRFPGGRLPSPRWRWADRLTIAVGITAVIAIALRGGSLPLYPERRSPIGVTGFPGDAAIDLAYLGMFMLFVAAAVSLVTRWRRGSVVERDQIKWIVAAAVVALLIEIVNVAYFDPAAPNNLLSIVTSLGITLIPIAMGVAILRYRLYAIDRIISRTISYAVVTGLLGATFATLIVALQGVLAVVTGGQTIAVAASTLAVFALFQPILRRVRRTVDRRFDRAHYDAEGTIGSLAARLRADVDMTAVVGEMLRTADDAVRPTMVAVWLRGSLR